MFPFKSYLQLPAPVKQIIGAEFCIQLVNASFMTLLPLYMARRGFNNDSIALHIMFRFLGVFVLAIPVGRLIRTYSPIPLFFLSAVCVPLFGMASVAGIYVQSDVLTVGTLLFWGASFTLMQIPVLPYILEQCPVEQHSAALSFSYSTWSFGGIVSGIVIAALQYVNSKLFNEAFLLFLFSLLGFAGLIFIWPLRKHMKWRALKATQPMVTLQHGFKTTAPTNWPLIIKALIPTLIIATGAGLTIPFISLFFDRVHHMPTGQFGFLSFAAACLVAYAAIRVPEIKERIGFTIAIPGTQSLAVVALIALASTQYYAHLPQAVWIAGFCYLLRQPLMNMAGPMTTELVMSYVGKNNRAIISALTSAIWSGSWVLSGFLVALMFSHNIGFGNIFLITAGLYAFGVMLYMLLIRDFQRRVLLGEIEK